jgi:peptidoglycan-associated lipoprotein
MTLEEKNLKTLMLPLLLVSLLSACSSTATKPPVEDRTTPSAGTSTPVAPPPVASGPETAPVTTTDTTGTAVGDPRKDPNSPLAKRSIYFDYDSYIVKADYQPVVTAHAGYLTGNKAARVIVQGNTDDRGSREYNLALGQKRAEAVRSALMVLGAGDAQIEAISFGEEKPRAEGQSEAAWAENRRADIVYTDEQ